MRGAHGDPGKRCGHEKLQFAAATSERNLTEVAKAKVFWVLQRSRAKRAKAKNHIIFGSPRGYVG
jgi:hypothetical protein